MQTGIGQHYGDYVASALLLLPNHRTWCSTPLSLH
jgi:hypothetical protein